LILKKTMRPKKGSTERTNATANWTIPKNDRSTQFFGAKGIVGTMIKRFRLIYYSEIQIEK
jgi:hypothetical protein